MFDLAQPNAKPGPCEKCNGSGVYRWGAIVNGRATHEGPCHSCRGSGQPDMRQIRRNLTYNRHKIAAIFGGN